MVQTVLCLKWGDRYGPDYVNKLYSMVRRNTARPLRFVCITDDPTGLDKGVETREMPPFNLPEYLRGHPFRRMFIFDETLYDLEGDVLHFDVDLLVTGSVDDFFDFKPESTFCVAENWTQIGQGIGNMSIFRFRVGAHTNIWRMFSADPEAQVKTYRNSQTFVCRNISELHFWPSDWCLSFKHSLIPPWPLNFVRAPALPASAHVVAFTGKPDPDDALVGHWPVEAAWKKLYKHVRPTPWIAEHWC